MPTCPIHAHTHTRTHTHAHTHTLRRDWLSSLNLVVSTMGPSIVPAGWEFTMENPAYKGSRGSWNTGPITVSDGSLYSTAPASWQALLPSGGNTINVGATIIASMAGDAAASFIPKIFSVNDIPCVIASAKL
jgi:hypothetical protein